VHVRKRWSRAFRGTTCALVSAAIVGCGSVKGCSCGKKETKPTERMHTDVEMVGAGSEPRVELRVVRWSGLKYRMVLETTGSAALEGQPAVPGPTLAMTVVHDVLRGSADPITVRLDGGLVRIVEERGVLENVSIRHALTPAPVIDSWNNLLVALRGTTFKYRVAEDAAIASMHSELIGGVEPPLEVTKALDAGFETQRHFPFRFPPVAVGIGATWRFREKLDANGVHVVQVVEMSLRALDDRQATVGIRLRQEAPKQEVPHPLVPGKMAMLEGLRGDGEGEIAVDRMTGVPLTGRLTGMARGTLSGEVAGAHGQATLIWASLVQAKGSILEEDKVDSAAP
jgi:hypothetical protein